MLIYLMRHGEAKDAMEDSERSLSEKGKDDVRLIAEELLKRGVSLDRIFYSPLKRAGETAKIMAEKLLPVGEPTETHELKPDDDPNIWRGRLCSHIKDIMIIGHLPHIGRLSTILTSGNIDAAGAIFPTSGINCIKRKDGKHTLEWSLSPKDIEGKG
jgi:phosphohistidine phosphatase